MNKVKSTASSTIPHWLHLCRQSSQQGRLAFLPWRLYKASPPLPSQWLPIWKIKGHITCYEMSYVEHHPALLQPLLSSRSELVSLQLTSPLVWWRLHFLFPASRMTTLLLNCLFFVFSCCHFSAPGMAFVIYGHFSCRYRYIVVHIRPPLLNEGACEVHNMESGLAVHGTTLGFQRVEHFIIVVNAGDFWNSAAGGNTSLLAYF